MKKCLWILILLTVWILPAGVMADTNKDTQSLEEMVVTATRTQSDTGSIGGISATVITAEDIEAKQQTSLAEILNGVPGLDIAQNGGPGSSASVFLRGADSKNTLVLVDGIMLNDPSSSNRNPNIGSLTVDNIERIEIIRGATSVLYGSNATAGVINIITKKGKGKPQVSVGAEMGSYQTWKGYGSVSGKSSIVNYALSASRSRTDGFSNANKDNDEIPHAGNTSEDDGWRNDTLSARVGIDITPDFDINTTFRYTDSETDTDASAHGYTGDRFGGYPASLAEPDGEKNMRSDEKSVLGGLNVHNYFMDRLLESDLSLQVSDISRASYNNDGNFTNSYDGATRQIAWQGGLDFGKYSRLILGASHFEEEMESTSITEKDAYTNSFWIQDQITIIDGLDIVAGLRYDDHETFGGKTTYRIAPAYTVAATGTTFKASFGTGFRAPSLYELYSSSGNTDLKPEESETWDIGISQVLLNKTLKLDVTYFNTRYQDRIDWAWTGPGAWDGEYQQIDGVTKSHGVETSIRWFALTELEFGLSYTYNDTKDANGAKLVRRPENKFHLNTLYRPIDKMTINLDLYWVSEREAYKYAQDKDGNYVDALDSYFLANIAGSYGITKNIQIYARVDNIFDEFYEECWSYATPGRSAYAGIKYTF